MTYKELMSKSDACGKLAMSYYKKGEIDLMRFYLSASIGFKIRAIKSNEMICPETKDHTTKSLQNCKSNI